MKNRVELPQFDREYLKKNLQLQKDVLVLLKKIIPKSLYLMEI